MMGDDGAIVHKPPHGQGADGDIDQQQRNLGAADGLHPKADDVSEAGAGNGGDDARTQAAKQGGEQHSRNVQRERRIRPQQ